MNLFFVDTFEMAVPISCLIGILLLISPLIKKSYVAKWRYYMWLLIALRLILPFKISIFSPPITMELPSEIQGVPTAAESVQAINGSYTISLQTVLTLVWIAGIMIFVLYQLIAYSGFKRTVRRWAKPLEDKRVISFFEEIKATIGEKRRLDIKICKAVSTPMVFGFIKPVLLLPKSDYTKMELHAILKHELIHFRRNDILYKLVLMTSNALNWFNPLVYLMVNAANKDIELVCDAEVVKEQDIDFRRDYCRAILSVIHSKKSSSTPLSTCFIISKKVMKERFCDILDIRKKRKGIALFTVVAISAVVSGSVITFATEQVAEQVEDNLQIVERPTPKPTEPPELSSAVITPAPPASTPAITPVPKQQNSEETSFRDSNNPVVYYDNSTYTAESDTSYSTDIGYTDTAETDPSPTEPTDMQDNISAEDNRIGEHPQNSAPTNEANNIYESIGDPDSISSDGSKETYNLSDGNTVIVQYDENDEFDTGYILVE